MILARTDPAHFCRAALLSALFLLVGLIASSIYSFGFTQPGRRDEISVVTVIVDS